MSAQKAKFALFKRLGDMGFSYEEAQALRRIEMTLSRWFEGECGDGNDHASWCIERDETTQRPFKAIYPHAGKPYRHPIADREAGAMKRLQAIMALHVGCVPYVQTDPRGCALYILRKDIQTGEKLDSIYTRGVAVCA